MPEYVPPPSVDDGSTLTSVQAQGVRSRGTLLLSAGPFETCPAGVTLKIVVYGTAG